jgi:sodium-dependent dicarboxylate transporter 2/3/5
MTGARQWGFVGGLAVFAAMLLMAAPASMTPLAWRTAALVILMAIWWMTEALPLTVTALLPFVAFPFMGVMTANDVAAAYYSPILFLVLGGAFIALAIAIRHIGLNEAVSPTIRALVTARLLDRARILGAAMRVAYILSAAMPGVLTKTPLRVRKKELVLELPPDLAALASERIANRMKALGRLIGREPRVVVTG